MDIALGENNIAAMWGTHYKDSLNCVVDNYTKYTVRQKLADVLLHDFCSVTFKEIQESTMGLSTSVALSMDRLPAGAVKHAPPRLLIWFCFPYQCMH